MVAEKDSCNTFTNTIFLQLWLCTSWTQTFMHVSNCIGCSTKSLILRCKFVLLLDYACRRLKFCKIEHSIIYQFRIQHSCIVFLILEGHVSKEIYLLQFIPAILHLLLINHLLFRWFNNTDNYDLFQLIFSNATAHWHPFQIGWVELR